MRLLRSLTPPFISGSVADGTQANDDFFFCVRRAALLRAGILSEKLYKPDTLQ